jgi:hypothetical protein
MMKKERKATAKKIKINIRIAAYKNTKTVRTRQCKQNSQVVDLLVKTSTLVRQW